MTKINLLPYKRKSSLRKEWILGVQLGLGSGMLILMLTACWVWGLTVTKHYDTLLKHKESKERILAELSEKSKQLEREEERRSVLFSDFSLLTRGHPQNSTTVILLDGITRSSNPLDLWLSRLSNQGSQVEVEGRALKSHDILSFVDDLERNTFFEDLQTLEMRSEHDQGFDVHHFTLRFTIKD